MSRAPTIDDREAFAAFRTLLAYVSQNAGVRSDAPSRPSHYSSARVGPHPAGKSARWCRDHFPRMPQARRVGRDWTISVEAFEAWADARARELRARRASRGAPVVANDVATDAARYLEAAGLRATAGAKR